MERHTQSGFFGTAAAIAMGQSSIIWIFRYRVFSQGEFLRGGEVRTEAGGPAGFAAGPMLEGRLSSSARRARPKSSEVEALLGHGLPLEALVEAYRPLSRGSTPHLEALLEASFVSFTEAGTARGHQATPPVTWPSPPPAAELTAPLLTRLERRSPRAKRRPVQMYTFGGAC